MRASKYKFYDTLTQNNRVLPFYAYLGSALNETIFHQTTEPYEKLEKAASVWLFPSFFNFKLHHEDQIHIKHVPQHKITGYAIVTNKHDTLETCMKAHYKKNFRANINRLIKRLETCFDVTYEMYYGTITKTNYQVIMMALKQMLIARFNQRGDTNQVLTHWESYYSSIYDLILEKKASIFVIYANNKLIHVCVNHHLKDILFISIPSYNINYHKFALGNISIYKLLEWAIAHNYFMLDMAYGDLEYKRRWANYFYTFEHHILWQKNNLKQALIAKFEALILQTKNKLKAIGFDDILKKIKRLKIKRSNLTTLPNYTIEKSFDLNMNLYDSINLSDNPVLEVLVCDFLYQTKDHISSIKLYKHKSANAVIITSKSSNCKICFEEYLNLN
ncbi:GNAT family N-acetyltransferase [Tamlana fucoidanivorans]|uniref:GNAT family N-acetyltransferase n=1 Tax=Allotamlana fucoidanivorans TaxID=2583814 RepID=A0A5C4SQX0_9FLAO|nr:GNAT family N-acetyltransferase [Tamlana fucoidanivorans]TNJ46477.1 GNAT family N-acetyltransferase [Tamlana fucoidanivorans]